MWTGYLWIQKKVKQGLKPLKSRFRKKGPFNGIQNLSLFIIIIIINSFTKDVRINQTYFGDALKPYILQRVDE